MKPVQSSTQDFISSAIKKYLEYVKGFEIHQLCLMITGTEGEKGVVAFKRKRLHIILKQFGGFAIGTGAGQQWFHKRYDLPLLRDFVLDNGIWVDVCESSTTWPYVLSLWRSVKLAITEVFKKANVPSWCGCHISHTYSNGVCLYFHFASQVLPKDSKDLKLYIEAKKLATEAILKNKGALSHHHGVGFEHLPFMARYHDANAIKLLRNLKVSVDPTNICNPGKLIPTEEQVKNEKSNAFFSLGLDPTPKITSKL